MGRSCRNREGWVVVRVVRTLLALLIPGVLLSLATLGTAHADPLLFSSSLWDDCTLCHTASSPEYPNAARYGPASSQAGYPYAETYPGSTIAETSVHGGSSVIWPSLGYAGGDCRNCHGEQNTTHRS